LHKDGKLLRKKRNNSENSNEIKEKSTKDDRQKVLYYILTFNTEENKDKLCALLIDSFKDKPFTIEKLIPSEFEIKIYVAFVERTHLHLNSRRLSNVKLYLKNVETFSGKKKELLQKIKEDNIGIIKPRKKKEITWNYPKKRINKFKNTVSIPINNIKRQELDSFVINNLLKKTIISLFEGEINLDSKLLCEELLKKINYINPLYYNETLLSHCLFEIFMMINDNEKDKISIIGIDQKFQDNILNFNTSFRTDILIKYKKNLIIFELKFRNDRKDQAQNALSCLKFKKYPERSLLFLKTKHEEIFDDLERVYEIGLALFTSEEEHEMDFNCEIFLSSEYNIQNHFKVDFVNYMRQNLKHFITLSEEVKIF
jgi:hypothetical protein